MLIEDMEIEEFIRPDEIETILHQARTTPASEIETILAKAAGRPGQARGHGNGEANSGGGEHSDRGPEGNPPW